MPRLPNPDSPAAAVQPALADCVAEVGAEVLEETAAYHDFAEPPDADVDPEELV
jgi:hypothetical protein